MGIYGLTYSLYHPGGGQVAVLSPSRLQMGDNIGFHGKVQHLINLPQFC